MRLLLLALLVINLAVYLWGQAGEGYSSLHEKSEFDGADKGNVVLLSEVDMSAPVVAGEAGPVNADGRELVESEVLGDSEVCWVLGPFSKGEVFNVPDELAEVFWRREYYESDVDYWVLLGPYSGQEQASDMLRELKRKKIDSYLIRKGEMENTISLGVFSEESRAERHAKSMRSKGYGAEVRRVAEEVARFWLVYRGAPEGPVFTASMAFMESRESNNGGLSKKSCELIASYQ